MITFCKDGTVIRGAYERTERTEKLDRIVDEILATKMKIDNLDHRDKMIVAEKAHKRVGVRVFFHKNESISRPAIDVQNEKPTLYKHVQVPRKVAPNRASQSHSRIVELRSRVPPETFRKIAGDLKLALSSVQNEVAKHAKKACRCFELDKTNSKE